MDRRVFLQSTAALSWFGAPARGSGPTAPAAPPGFRLVETAGIRRYGYPVSVPLPAGDSDTDLRLTREGREVAAQFRRPSGAGAPATILDFSTSPGPFEVEEYLISPTERRGTRAESNRGMRASVDRGTIEVANPPYITFSLGEDLAGFLRSVRIPGLEFLQPRSGGFFANNGGERTYLGAAPPAGGAAPRAVVTRQGPLAVGVGFEHVVPMGGGAALAWSLAMSFPSTKSWVEVAWSIADPEDRITSMGLDLNLLLDGGPILVECGARSTVYSTLEPEDHLAFESGPRLSEQGRELSWRIARGRGNSPALEAVGLRKDGVSAEGWVHAMDSRRCTAMAVASFGAGSNGTLDLFEVEGNGLLRFERQFLAIGPAAGARKLATKGLKFWIHFVTMPVQVGAKTSPQAMLAPLEVRWRRP
jgi:hypothetical protein